MTISVENFINREQGKRRNSKLEPFKNDILKLKQSGFSQKQIQQFLAENGLKVGLTTINWFLKTRLKNIDSAEMQKWENTKFINNTTKEEPSPVPAATIEKEARQNNGKFQNQKNSQGKNKFDWQKKIPDDEIF